MPIHLNTNAPPFAAPDLDAPAQMGRLSRRDFLAVVAAGGAAAILPRPGPFADRAWALLADTHMQADRAHVARGSNMAENLFRAAEAVRSARPDAVVVNGDLAFDAGLPGDYRAFREVAASLVGGPAPLHLTLGNHDHREHLLAAFGLSGRSPVAHKRVSCATGGDMRFVFLDSLEPSLRYPGRLGAAQLRWLRDTLDADRSRPTVVFVHHNPDNPLLGLQDGPELCRALLPRRHVKAVFFGHTHEFRHWTEAGLHFINQPATGYLFDPKATLGWLRADWRRDGLDLSFQSLDTSRQEHGRRHRLTWRGDHN